MNQQKGLPALFIVNIPLTGFLIALQPLGNGALQLGIILGERMVCTCKQPQLAVCNEHLRLIVPDIRVGFGSEVIQHHIDLNHTYMVTRRNIDFPNQRYFWLLFCHRICRALHEIRVIILEDP
ncbi:hypothetical protein D3C80_1780710 [compost metagenome]